MTTPDPIPFGFAGKPQVADTAVIPMVVVPVELLRRCLKELAFLERLCDQDARMGLVDASQPAAINLAERRAVVIADLQDAIAQE